MAKGDLDICDSILPLLAEVRRMMLVVLALGGEYVLRGVPSWSTGKARYDAGA